MRLPDGSWILGPLVWAVQWDFSTGHFIPEWSLPFYSGSFVYNVPSKFLMHEEVSREEGEVSRYRTNGMGKKTFLGRTTWRTPEID